jgi:hypothetical protein
MKWQACIILALIGVFVFLSIAPPETDAIPAFARRYKMSCTTCHAPFPRLKDFGNEFAGNGFYIPEDDKERDYVTGGDPLLWLNKTFPIAARVDLFGQYDSDQDFGTDLQTPWGVKLLSGGAVSKNIGYYFYFYLTERGEVAGLEDAYIHFNNIKGWELDIMVGQFQTSDPLMKRELRLTREDYFAYVVRPGESKINLTYDRGVMVPFSITKTSTDIVGMVVNGNGLPDAEADRVYDENEFKNVGLRLNQGIVDIASIGGFVYHGRERSTLSGSAPEDEVKVDNEVTYLGADGSVGFGARAALTAQYLYRKDTNPFFLEEASDVETNSLIAELILSPDIDASRYHLTLLYNLVDSDDKASNYETGTASLSYLLARNARLMGEYSFYFEENFNRVVLGFIGAF